MLPSNLAARVLCDVALVPRVPFAAALVAQAIPVAQWGPMALSILAALVDNAGAHKLGAMWALPKLTALGLGRAHSSNCEGWTF